MINERKNAIYAFVIYAFLLLLDSLIRVNMIINVLPANNKFALIYVSTFLLCISTGFMAFIVLMTISMSYLILFIFDGKIETNYLMLTWKNLFVVNILFEVIKIVLIWILFSSEIDNLSAYSDNIGGFIETLSFTKVNRIIDQITIYVSVFAFILTLYKYYSKEKLLIISLGVFILSLNLLLYYRYI